MVYLFVCLFVWAWVHRAYRCYCAWFNIVVSILAVWHTVHFFSYRRIAIHTVFFTHSHTQPPSCQFTRLLAFYHSLSHSHKTSSRVVDNQLESEKEDRVKIERKQRCPVTVTGSDLHSFLFLFLFGCCSLHNLGRFFEQLPSLHFGLVVRVLVPIQSVCMCVCLYKVFMWYCATHVMCTWFVRARAILWNDFLLEYTPKIKIKTKKRDKVRRNYSLCIDKIITIFFETFASSILFLTRFWYWSEWIISLVFKHFTKLSENYYYLYNKRVSILMDTVWLIFYHQSK